MGPLSRICVETTGQQIPALGRQSTVVSPVRKPQHYLRVRLEGNVATKHVVEEDAQGPHCQTVGCVAPVFDPLWRSIDPSTCNNNILNIKHVIPSADLALPGRHVFKYSHVSNRVQKCTYACSAWREMYCPSEERTWKFNIQLRYFQALVTV